MAGWDIIIALWAIVIGLAACEILTMYVLRNQIKRYEKFRNEAGYVFTGLQEQLLDVNRRLIQAGYPAGRVTPTTMPDWFANGLLPDGSPAPTDLRS